MLLLVFELFCVKIINYVVNLIFRCLCRFYVYIYELCKRIMFYKSYKFNIKCKLMCRRSL